MLVRSCKVIRRRFHEGSNLEMYTRQDKTGAAQGICQNGHQVGSVLDEDLR